MVEARIPSSPLDYNTPIEKEENNFIFQTNEKNSRWI
jgi:hypothetical protein